MANWYLRSGASGTNAGTSWTNAAQNHTQLGALGLAAGDTVFVADDHNETTNHTTHTSYFVFVGDALAPLKYLCVDRTVATPNAEKDLRTGAKIKFTASGGSWNANFGSSMVMYGIEWNIGDSSANVPAWAIGSYGGFILAEKCIFRNTSTGVSSSLNFATLCRLNDCVIDTSARNDHYISFSAGRFEMTGGEIISGAAQSLFLFAFSNNNVHFRGVDLRKVTFVSSSVALFDNGYGIITLEDCILPSTGKLFEPNNTSWAAEFQIINFIRCSRAGTAGNYVSDKIVATATQTADKVVVATGGGSIDGLTPISHKIATTSRMYWAYPINVFPIVVPNVILQSDITVNVEGVASPVAFSALPKNDEVWIDVSYQAHSGNTWGNTISGRNKTIFTTGVAHAASTQAWDSKLPARVASTAYAVGDAFKVSGNPGRVFFCTTAGNSSSDATGTAYNSAVDGGTVNESSAGSGGTAVFKAGWRFKMSIKIAGPQVQQTGPITVTPKMGKASATLYIDPKVTLS